MKLTRTERWILVNQYRILEALYPDEAKWFAENREALSSGYELHYRGMIDFIYDEEDTDLPGFFGPVAIGEQRRFGPPLTSRSDS
jgi:hypothetical protein